MAPLEISLSPSVHPTVSYPLSLSSSISFLKSNLHFQIGHCTAPRNLVKPRKEESRDFSGGRRSSKVKLMPWKKLDANEFGIQRSMIPESTRMVVNKLRKKRFQV